MITFVDDRHFRTLDELCEFARDPRNVIENVRNTFYWRETCGELHIIGRFANIARGINVRGPREEMRPLVEAIEAAMLHPRYVEDDRFRAEAHEQRRKCGDLTLANLHGRDVADAYEHLYGEVAKTAGHHRANNPNVLYSVEDALQERAYRFGEWLTKLRGGDASELRLNDSYGGKKTRALLYALGVEKAPRTKGELARVLGIGKAVAA